jgi:hypothetical protein
LSYEEASTLPFVSVFSFFFRGGLRVDLRVGIIFFRCAALTAYNALLSGFEPLKVGDTILVQGTGGVSMCAHDIFL